MNYNKKIVLKDGREFYGQGFGGRSRCNLRARIQHIHGWDIRKLFLILLIRIKWF